MSDLTTLLKIFYRTADHPREAVLQSMQHTGRKAVGCFPLYTPDELVYAAGFLPVGMWGGTGDASASGRYVQSFCCSVMKANISQALSDEYNMLSAVIIPAFCDTLKCVGENWKAANFHIPAFLMVYPQNSKALAGRMYLEEEFERIQKKLEELSGHAVTEEALEESWKRYEACRLAQREFTQLASLHPKEISVKTRHKVIKAGYFMDPVEYEEILTAVNDDLRGREKSSEQCACRVVVTGILMEPDDIPDAFDTLGICIAADDLGQESRRFRIEGAKEGNIYARMAGRFANQSGDPLIYDPQKSRGRRLIQMVKESSASGVVILMMKFCDPEEFDFPIYKRELEEAGIPYLYLELEQSGVSAEGIKTRLEGFVEMLHTVKK